MSIKNSKVLFAFLCISIVAGSCKAPEEPAAEASFVDQKLQLIQLTATPAVDWDVDGIPDKDIYALLEPCEKDDQLVFNKDHRVRRSPGAEKCEEEEPGTIESGSWQYNGQNQTLTVNENGQQQEYQVIRSASDQLVMSYRFNDSSDKAHVITAVYRLIP